MARTLSLWQARVGLALLAAFTSANFIIMKIAVEEISPTSVVIWRFFFAAICLISVRKHISFTMDAIAWRDGAYVGSLLSVSMILLAATMRVAKTGESAFFVNTDALFVPLLLLIFCRQVPAWTSVCGLAIATPGLALLSLNEGFQLRAGSLVGIIGAIGFAWWLIGLTRVTYRNHPFALALSQMISAFLVALILSVLFGQLDLPATRAVWFCCIYLGVVGTGFRFALQGYLQRFIPPTEAALIYLIEPVCAAAWGMVILQEYLTQKQLWGCALILTGVAFSQIKLSKTQAVPAATPS